MKCQEVMMYMQRQLDGDLAPKEEDELHAHLMHCLDCAQMFERLQSIVDRIVPAYLKLCHLSVWLMLSCHSCLNWINKPRRQ